MGKEIRTECVEHTHREWARYLLLLLLLIWLGEMNKTICFPSIDFEGPSYIKPFLVVSRAFILKN